MSKTAWLRVATEAALAAGNLIRGRFGCAVQVNESTDHDIKIQTDIDSQNLIYSILKNHYPDHCLVGEEGNAGNPNGAIEWVVDPIDGTLNFATGIPHFCISIAARKRGGAFEIGVIYDPMRHELFTAIRGEPAYLNGTPISVSERTNLKEAVLAVGFAKTTESIDHCLKLYQFYGREAKKLRAMGSAALDLAYVAAGRLDAYIEQGISLWDVAAGALLVECAGGQVDSEAKPDGKFRYCASSGHMELPLR